jgi:hypothetical protein
VSHHVRGNHGAPDPANTTARMVIHRWTATGLTPTRAGLGTVTIHTIGDAHRVEVSRVAAIEVRRACLPTPGDPPPPRGPLP